MLQLILRPGSFVSVRAITANAISPGGNNGRMGPADSMASEAHVYW